MSTNREKIYKAFFLSPAEYDVLDCLGCEEQPITFERMIEEYESLGDYLTADLDVALERLIEDGLIACWEDKSLVITKRGKEVITFSESTRE